MLDDETTSTTNTTKHNPFRSTASLISQEDDTEKTPISPTHHHNHQTTNSTSLKQRMRNLLTHNNIQLSLTFIAVIIGVVVGILVNQLSVPSQTTIKLLHFPGELLLRMLNCLIVPLVVTSMVSSMTSLGDIRHQGKIGLLSLLYYMTTTILAVIIGITMVNVIQPGKRGGGGGGHHPIEPKNNPLCPASSQNPTTLDTVLTVFYDMFPNNLIDAASSTCHLNVLGLITVSLTFGAVLSSMGEEGAPVRSFFHSLNKVIMKLVMVVIWYAPVGICFLIIWRLAKEPNLAATLGQLAFYILTVFAGLAIHSLIVIPLLYLVIVRRNPLRHLWGMSGALLTALGTSSSSATMPVTMDCCENRLNLSSKVTHFVIPLGATVNMDGTACYEAVAAIFVAQALGIELGFGKMIIVCLTATLASIGAAGIPEAGLITLVLVVESVGLPVEGISMLLAVDWFLDRFRTVVNVWGDSVGCAIVDKLIAKSLVDTADTTDTAVTALEDNDDGKSNL